jgi:polyisoprenoid-binding protein YceI
MKKYWIVILLAVGFSLNGYMQTFVTKTGMIRFYSDAPLEKIEGINRQVNAAFLTSTGDFVFKVLIKSFNFEKALLQEHFNENYLESANYPEATFLGKVTNVQGINFSKEGSYPVTVEGKLTIHGQTQFVKENGTFEIKNGSVTAKTKFNILLADYKISIPTTVVNSISKTIEITVEVMMTELSR